MKNNKAAKWVYLIVAIMCIGFAFDYSKKVGASLVIIAAMGLLITAQKRRALNLTGGN
jgi:hypothetical protein